MKNLINKFKNKINKVKIVSLSIFLFLISTTPVFAAPDIGRNASTWFLDQLFWIIIIAAFLVAAKYFSKGNTVKMIAVIVVGGLLLVLVKNPTMLEKFGNWILEIIGVR